MKDTLNFPYRYDMQIVLNTSENDPFLCIRYGTEHLGFSLLEIMWNNAFRLHAIGNVPKVPYWQGGVKTPFLFHLLICWIWSVLSYCWSPELVSKGPCIYYNILSAVHKMIKCWHYVIQELWCLSPLFHSPCNLFIGFGWFT